MAATWDQSTVAVYVDRVFVLTVPSQGDVLNPSVTIQSPPGRHMVGAADQKPGSGSNQDLRAPCLWT